MEQDIGTVRGGSVVTHETRVREVPGQIPCPTNLVEVFSGFLNLKIAKEFNVSRDLKPLLSTKW